MRPSVGTLTASQLDEILRDILRWDIEPHLRRLADEGLTCSCSVRMCGAEDLPELTVSTERPGSKGLAGEIRVALFGATSPVRYEYQVLLEPHPANGFTGLSARGRLTLGELQKAAPRGGFTLEYNRTDFRPAFR